MFLAVLSVCQSLFLDIQVKRRVKSSLTKQCFASASSLASISLSQAAHSAKPGSNDEKLAQKSLKDFNEQPEVFPIFETGRNENSSGNATYKCYIENYSTETIRIAKRHQLIESLKSKNKLP